MSARIVLNREYNSSGVPKVVIDRAYPSILTGVMSLDEWNEACDSIDRVLDEATKFSSANMCFKIVLFLTLLASMIIGGVIGYFVGPTTAKPGDTEDLDGKAIIGAIFGVVLAIPAYIVLINVAFKCCGICTHGNKGLLDVCRHLIMAVEDISKLNPNVTFTIMEGLYEGGSKVIDNTEEIFDLKKVWIQAVVDGSNDMVANEASHQRDKLQQVVDRQKILNQSLNEISNRPDLNEIQKEKLREKFIEDFL
jgi:Golgin subfamily A member 7/ERF4 family.